MERYRDESVQTIKANSAPLILKEKSDKFSIHFNKVAVMDGSRFPLYLVYIMALPSVIYAVRWNLVLTKSLVTVTFIRTVVVNSFALSVTFLSQNGFHIAVKVLEYT